MCCPVCPTGGLRRGVEGAKQARFPQRAERRKATKGKRPEGFEEGYPSPELYVELDDDTDPADQDRDERVRGTRFRAIRARMVG